MMCSRPQGVASLMTWEMDVPLATSRKSGFAPAKNEGLSTNSMGNET